MAALKTGSRAPLIAVVRATEGAVMLEFLLAFMPIFTLFLGITQIGLIGVADLVVRHAAVVGVRSAIVVLEDDPRFYGGEPVRTIASASPSSEGEKNHATATSRLFETQDSKGPSAEDEASAARSRVSDIRAAITLPLAAIAPDLWSLGGMVTSGPLSVDRALGRTPASRYISAMLYHDQAVAITFPVAPKSPQLHAGSIPADADVTVRVTYLFHCAVPLASALLCSSFSEADEEDLGELGHAPGAKNHPLLFASGARFKVLRAEATLPSQGAPYAYASKESS